MSAPTGLRPLLLVFATLPLIESAAQTPEIALQFTPFELERTYQHEGFYMALKDEMATRDHVVLMEQPAKGKGGGSLFFHAFPRGGTGTAGTLQIEIEGKAGEFYYDRMLAIGERFYILHNTVDKKTGVVDVIARQYALPSFAPQGAPTRLARIEFDPRSLDMTRGLRSRIEVSDDGEHVVLFFDRIRSKEKEQLLLVFAMDKDLAPRWQQGYRVPFQADRIGTHGVEVSDQGVVYALLRSIFENRRAITNTSVNFSFELFGLTKDGMASQPVELPERKAVLSAGLAMEDGRPMVAGFYVEPHHTTKETAGYFVSSMDPGLSGAARTRTQAFGTTLDERIWDMMLIKRQNGGYYLTGGGQQQVTDRIWDHFIQAVAVDRTGAHEWDTFIPRRVYNTDYREMGYHAVEGAGHLMLLFREPGKNFERYLSGEELKAVVTHDRVTVCATLDRNGQVHYQKLTDEHDLECLPSAFMTNSGLAPYEHGAVATRKEGKKTVDGVVIVSLK